MNDETRAIWLWLNNDQDLYSMASMLAEEAADEESDATEQQATLAESLKEWLEEVMPELDLMWNDLLRSALSEVDWHSIAEGFLEDEEQDAL